MVGKQETGGWWDSCAETARRERAAVPRAEIQGAERTLDLGRRKSLRTPGSSPTFPHPHLQSHREKLCSEGGI